MKEIDRLTNDPYWFERKRDSTEDELDAIEKQIVTLKKQIESLRQKDA